jgi:glyoxylase-like metal-dependent hydrolase (beta-lactamase superfamily II)
MRSTVYLVQCGSSWALVHTGSAGCDGLIRQAVESLFGANARPASILLTHDHPDHVGQISVGACLSAGLSGHASERTAADRSAGRRRLRMFQRVRPSG